MSIQEKKPLVSLVSNLLIFGIYYLLVFRKYNQSGFSSEEELRFWAAVILILVPVLIVAKIVLYILFSIVNTIVTKEQESMLTDELDNLIELKSTRNFYHERQISRTYVLFFRSKVRDAGTSKRRQNWAYFYTDSTGEP